MKYNAVLIDPVKRTATGAKLKGGRAEWLRTLPHADFLGAAADEVYKHMHYELPMDAISLFIGGSGGMVSIFATPVALGVYLVLHDDIVDQDTERGAFVIDVDDCILDPRVARNLHFESAVLIRADGKQIQAASFHVEWRSGRPREGGGHAVCIGSTPGQIVVADRIADPVACGYCENPETVASFSKCGRCLTVSYCSRKCQKLHWKQHKPTCDMATREGPVNLTIATPQIYKR
jgi:hypothetical protein